MCRASGWMPDIFQSSFIKGVLPSWQESTLEKHATRSCLDGSVNLSYSRLDGLLTLWSNFIHILVVAGDDPSLTFFHVFTNTISIFYFVAALFNVLNNSVDHFGTLLVGKLAHGHLTCPLLNTQAYHSFSAAFAGTEFGGISCAVSCVNINSSH